MRILFLALPVLAALSVTGCPASTAIEDGVCKSDADCGDFRFCDPAGACRCLSDDACDAAEFCNLAGSCQAKTECITDEDCRADGNIAAICDTRAPIPSDQLLGGDDNLRSRTGGQCVTLNNTDKQCLIDSHCPFGFFCNASICQPGCRDNGDCALGEPCINGACDATPGACNEIGYCEFGQTCDLAGNRCVTHPDASTLCTRCRGDDPADNTCDVCLIDTSIPPTTCTSDAQCPQGYCVQFPCLSDSDCGDGETCEGGSIFELGRCSPGHCGDFFCGNDACGDATDPCPRGYGCFTLIVVSNNICSKGGGQCPSGSTCSADAPGELNENGSCSCLSDADCPLGLDCVNPGPGGACVQGSTCGPSSGLTCEDIK